MVKWFPFVARISLKDTNKKDKFPEQFLKLPAGQSFFPPPVYDNVWLTS